VTGPKHLTPTDEARIALVGAAMVVVGALHASDEDAQAADDALDLAAIRLVTELEAERRITP
jgi:hypothetical protein